MIYCLVYENCSEFLSSVSLSLSRVYLYSFSSFCFKISVVIFIVSPLSSYEKDAEISPIDSLPVPSSLKTYVVSVPLSAFQLPTIDGFVFLPQEEKKKIRINTVMKT